MVRMCTGNFTLDMLESSGARARAVANGPCGSAPTGPHGATPPSPPPPPSLVSIEQMLATQNELMRVLTENIMH
jgi:hypothetical protein